jgi:hypothetical protein
MHLRVSLFSHLILLVAGAGISACGSDSSAQQAGGSAGAAGAGGTAGTGGTAGSAGSAGSNSSGGSSGSAGGGASPADPDPAPTPGSGTTYYLSPAGDDGNSGTSPSAAWQSIGKVNETSFAAGDTLLLEGGQVFAGTLRLSDDDDGTAAQPISLSSYGGGRAIIEAGAAGGISVYNTAGVQIWELVVRGGWNATTQDGNDAVGISVYTDLVGATKLDYVVIDRVEVSGFKNGGISVGAWPADGKKSGFSNVRISNALVHDNGDHGVSSWGYWDNASSTYAHTKIRVRGCEVFDNHGIASKGSHSGSGIVIGDTDGALIERNVAYRNGAKNNHTGGGPVGIWAWDSNDVTIQLNESHGNRSATLDGGGFDLDGGVTNSVMQYNYSHDNDGPGYLVAQFTGARAMKGLTIRYNISQNDAQADTHGAITFWNGNGANGINDVDVYHNTVYVGAPSAGSPALGFASGTNRVRVLNNIFVTSGGTQLVSLGSGHTDLVLARNGYHAVGGSASVPAEDASGLSVDPGLTGVGTGPTLGHAWLLETLTAYRLQDGSPMIDAGSSLTEYAIDPGGRDFFGGAVGQGGGPDIGAHELR